MDIELWILTDLKGQLCGRLLADLGMEVIKVEPTEGDSDPKLWRVASAR